MSMFIKLTDTNSDPVHIKQEAIKALMVSEYPRANTAVLIGDNPDGTINVIETMSEVLAMLRDKEQATPMQKPTDEDTPILDKESFNILKDIYGCRVDVYNKGYQWRVHCGNHSGDYYPTTERFDIAGKKGKNKTMFLSVIKEIAAPF